MPKLDQLNLEKSKKFTEICELVACELGYRGFAAINPEDRRHIEREAEQQVTEWGETTEFRTRSNIRPITPLRRLLRSIRIFASESSMSKKSRSSFGRTNEGHDGNVDLRIDKGLSSTADLQPEN